MGKWEGLRKGEGLRVGIEVGKMGRVKDGKKMGKG